MDVINSERKCDDHRKDLSHYILTEEDVENILVSTDALYWTILQLLQCRQIGAAHD